MPITLYEDDSPLKGAQLFANQAMRNFLSETKDKTEPKYVALREMMKGNLYFTDLRMPKDTSSTKIDQQSHQFDIVGFKKNGESVGFTVLCDQVFHIKGFQQRELSKMSSNTQEMAGHISEQLNPNPPRLN